MKSDDIKRIAEELCDDTEDEKVQAICLNTLMIGELNTTLVFLKNEVRKPGQMSHVSRRGRGRMKVYLPVVFNRTKGEVCISPDGAYEDYVGAIHGLAKQEEYIKSDTGNTYGDPVIYELDVDPQGEYT